MGSGRALAQAQMLFAFRLRLNQEKHNKGEWMGFDHWLVAVWDKGVKEREFVLEFWDSSIAIGAKGSFRTSEPMSEEKLREELAKLGVLKEKADSDIARARSTS